MFLYLRKVGRIYRAGFVSSKELKTDLHMDFKRVRQLNEDSVIQYWSCVYVDLIQKSSIKMSMCSSAEPNDNSMAERLNRTQKEEFNLGNGFVSEEAVLKTIPQVIETYNNYRPHASLDFKTPTQCHNSGRV